MSASKAPSHICLVYVKAYVSTLNPNGHITGHLDGHVNGLVDGHGDRDVKGHFDGHEYGHAAFLDGCVDGHVDWRGVDLRAEGQGEGHRDACLNGSGWARA